MSRALAPPVGAGLEQRCGGFGRDRDDLDGAVGQPAGRLAHRELGVEMRDRAAAFRLRQHDRVRLGGDDGIEIGVGEAGLQAVDPDQ